MSKATKTVIKVQDPIRFLDMLTKVSGAVAKTDQFPALTGILIEADGENITMTASDKSTIRVTDNGVISTGGKTTILVGGKMFVEVIKKVPKEGLQLIKKENQIEIVSGRTKFSLNIMKEEDFPKIANDAKANNSFELPAIELVKGLKKTVYASAVLVSRPVLSGICMETDGTSLKFIATDSHRLAIWTTHLDKKCGPFKNIVIPSDSAKEITKLLDSDENVQVAVMGNQLRITTEKVMYLTRLIEGTYPEINRIIPDHFNLEFTCNKSELAAAVSRTKIFTDITKMWINADSEIPTAQFVSQKSEYGQGVEEIFVADVKGESQKFAVNANYLLEAVKEVDDEGVRVSITNPVSPIVIRPVNEKEQYFCLVLPIRLS